MSLATQLTTHLDSLEKGDTIERFMDRQAVDCVELMEQIWPSRLHPDNVWATNASVIKWRWQQAAPYVRIVENTAEYSGYTDKGFTKKGKHTAGPWKARAVGDSYTGRGADIMAKAMQAELPSEVLDG